MPLIVHMAGTMIEYSSFQYGYLLQGVPGKMFNFLPTVIEPFDKTNFKLTFTKFPDSDSIKQKIRIVMISHHNYCYEDPSFSKA